MGWTTWGGHWVEHRLTRLSILWPILLPIIWFLAVTVHCGQNSQHRRGHIEAIHGLKHHSLMCNALWPLNFNSIAIFSHLSDCCPCHKYQYHKTFKWIVQQCWIHSIVVVLGISNSSLHSTGSRPVTGEKLCE